MDFVRCEAKMSSTVDVNISGVLGKISQFFGNLSEPCRKILRGKRTDILRDSVFCGRNRTGFFLLNWSTSETHKEHLVSGGEYNIVDAYNKEEAGKAKKEHRKAELLPRFFVHVLRHTACTNMARTGMNIKAVQYVMGHANCEVTMNVYNHLANADEAREEMHRAGFLGRVV